MQSRSKVQSKARNSRTTTPLTFACRRYTSKQTANKNVWTRAASKKTQVSTHWSCLSGPLHQQYHEINCLNNVLVSLVAKENSRETALLVKIQSKCSLTVTSLRKLRIHMRVRFLYEYFSFSALQHSLVCTIPCDTVPCWLLWHWAVPGLA